MDYIGIYNLVLSSLGAMGYSGLATVWHCIEVFILPRRHDLKYDWLLTTDF